LKRLLLVVALLASSPARAVELTVFHTNDVHGWILPRPAKLASGTEPAEASNEIGGMAALAARVRAHNGPRLLLDAGDWFQGTPEGTTSKGAVMMDLFDALGYDAVEVGNHDFDFGRENLQALVKRAKTPVLGGNVYDEKSGRRVDFLRPWIVKDVAGVKVGIFGLLTTAMPRLVKSEHYAGLRFRAEIEEARDAVKALREQGATVVIAVTHVGFAGKDMPPFDDDKAIAAGVPGIDLIVGGHTHTILREPYRDPKNGTLIAQAGHALSRVGRVTLRIDDKTKRVVSSRGELVSLWRDRGEDAEIVARIGRFEPEIRRVYDVALATASRPLLRRRGAESELGDWMADCERERGGTDVAIQGYIPADMPGGPITLRSILDVMPFDNRLVKLAMRGNRLQEAVDRRIGRQGTSISLSGASVAYDRARPAGSRVLKASVGGKPLDPSRVYTVSTDDFLARGGDGDATFENVESKEVTDILVRDILADCARRQRVVKPPPGGRMKDVGEAL
jgi:5'-nucleotidase / UDP-sugar diphosphatase